ncbi:MULTISPECIES: OmpA family protein [unclassified Sphingobacterium]|uniref:OmpA family protein n=1 Tax=unclassified Sphingobacterium TaxID=2609468 RepID=UPI0025F4C537|nr:OmpA family protein [Sphingobacterium sp. UBA3549]
MILKKTLLMLAAVAGAKVSLAQQIDVKPDTVMTVSTDRYQVETNRFWDNWFINAGAGAQIYFGDHDKQMKFSERLTPSFEFNLGKWFSPGVGVRAGLTGFKVKGLTQNGSHSTGVQYAGKPWDGYWLYNQEFNYFHIHGDVLFNLSNIFSGYKKDRFYNISPYVGLGWMVTNDAPKQKEVSANIGIYNSFRLSDALDLTFDVRGAMVNDRFDGETGHRSQDGNLSAALGLTYKFKQRGWEKPSSVVITYSDALLNSLRQKVQQLAEDNEALKAQLAASQGKTITDIRVEEKILAAPILVTFPINQSVVSNEARVNLGFFAKVIQAGNKDITYKVTGYADKGTGTKAINDRLSRERAQAIYDVLVKEFHVSPQQLELAYEGGVDNMYYDDPRLSRAVITIAK